MPLDHLRTFCLSLPAVSEDVKWDHDLCFSVGGKMFCVASLEPPLTFSLKVPDDQFDELLSQPGVVPAPYLARYKWVLLEEGHPLSERQVTALVRQSYDLIKGKMPKKELKAAGLL
ncbi:hypothetical protein EFA69_17720 [Rufibacter immobilis]|uniref:MmcQ/YjbR family DNA-binding protein n=1 Tax=Rufibacter immobilis TaxID=1348778 RepID=A0A3M9MQY9_9BACT|nr:MmcQ/YjbR family DNA-binding protein [Rufibacter immobilis]RNI27926.1 hypothetical protein EFA69_17720 [Rufibacter immobilis]